MDILNLIIILILDLLFAMFILYKIKKDKRWTISLWVFIWLYVYYCVIPTITIFEYIIGSDFHIVYDKIIVKHKYYIDFPVLIGISLFLTTYLIISSIRFTKFRHSELKLNIYGRNISIIKIFVLATLFFSIFSFLIYISVQGGILNAIRNAQDINLLKVKGNASMFKRFIPLAIYCLLLSFLFNKKFFKLFIIIVSVVILVVFSFLERQRQVMMFYMLIPVFGYLINKNKIITKKIIIYSGIIFIIFPVIHFLNKSHSYDKTSYESYEKAITIDKLINEFNFPYISLYVAQNTKYNKLILDDYWTGVFGNYLPTSLIDDPRPANSLNSYFFLNKKSRDIPPGIIANGYYHMGFLGIVFFAFILGLGVNFTDRILTDLINYDTRYSYVFSFFFWGFFAYIRTGILGFSLYNPLFLLLFIILIISFYLVPNKY